MIKSLRYFIIAALAYYLSGQLGLLLAISPGFASAVWPASGVALTCALLMGRFSGILGIGFGSFLINLGLTSESYSHLTFEAIIPTVLIAMGAMGQAFLGRFLFKKLIGQFSHIDSIQEIIRFVFLIAPVGCLLAATVGVSTLLERELINLDNFTFSWLTWWVGDTIGVWLVTPLLVSLFSPHQEMEPERKVQVALPSLLILIGVLTLFFISSESRHQNIHNEIQSGSKRFFLTIEDRLDISKSKLDSYLAFYRSSEYVSRDEFNEFSHILLKDDSIFQGVGWTEIVAARDRVKYEKEIRQLGFEAFTFTEFSSTGELRKALVREEYYPVLYIFPFERNKKAFGLNLAANPDRLNALLKARKEAVPIATAPIRLAQETTQQRAIILYVPVFDTKNKFKGYVSGVFRVVGILGGVIQEANELNFGIRINDVTDPHHVKPLVDAVQIPLAGFEAVHERLSFGERIYDVEIYASENFYQSSRDWSSWAILTLGFLIAAVLQSFILIITGNTKTIRREVKRKTEDLLQAKLAAETANKAKSNFTANMSHEIRTPLNAIVGLVNLCMKTALLPQQQRYLERVQLASDTLLSLINHTLDYSKIESGKLEFENIKFDLSHILRKIYAIFSTQSMDKDVIFSLDLPEEIPKYVIGDPLRLEQILLNLCSNALKFTFNGQVVLKLRITSKNNSDIQIEFSVSDTGIGISDDQQKYLFESFHQADTSTGRKFGGTGLGLAICKQLAELMGGSIKFNSVENKGSCFEVILDFEISPETEYLSRSEMDLLELDQVEADSEASTSRAGEVAQAQAGLSVDKVLKGVQVLLVEDIEINQMIAREMLEDAGAKVRVADNGIEALHELSLGYEFDVVLMDIQMPKMDGYEATEQIRKNKQYQNLPIIAVTANAMSTDIEKCHAVGMNDHIAKPIDEMDMINKIKNQLTLN